MSWISNVRRGSNFADEGFMVDYVIHQKCFAGLIFPVLGQSTKTTKTVIGNEFQVYSVLKFSVLNFHRLLGICGKKVVAPYGSYITYQHIHMYMYYVLSLLLYMYKFLKRITFVVFADS